MNKKPNVNFSFDEVIESLSLWRSMNTKGYWLRLEEKLQAHLHSLSQEDLNVMADTIRDAESRITGVYQQRWSEWKAETDTKLKNHDLSRKWLKYAACALLSFHQRLVGRHHVMFWWEVLYNGPHSVQDETIQLAIRRIMWNV